MADEEQVRTLHAHVALPAGWSGTVPDAPAGRRSAGPGFGLAEEETAAAGSAGEPGQGGRRAVLRLRVEDYGAADRRAPAIATLEIPVEEGATSVDAEIDVPAGLLDPQGSYAVFAHLDVGDTGDVKRGDALTTRIHPVLADAAAVDVTLTQL